MTIPATRSAIRESMTDAQEYMRLNIASEQGSMAAIDLALCSIAESLQALTGILFRINLDAIYEFQDEDDANEDLS